MISYHMIDAAAPRLKPVQRMENRTFSEILTLKNDIIKQNEKIKIHKTCR